MHFLDKFVYRNPKAEESKRGGSIMQPILASGSASHIVASTKAAARQQPMVNSSSFWSLKPDQVSAEDVFFHEYFARVGKSGEAARAKKTPRDDQAGSDDEAAGEEEIWDALVNSQPEIEGADAEEDSDMDLDEFDYSDNEMDVDGVDADGNMSDLGSEGDAGFEGIFDDSEESDDQAGASEAEWEDEDEDEVKDEAEVRKEPFKRDSRGRLNRKEMKSLPTFASVEDYAEMLAGEDDLDG
jgi:ribosome biogenesis protein MAK21